jgi:SsrA-binding protein
MLTGGEVKMLRGQHGSLAGSHVRLINDQPVLLNAQIPPYPYARNENYDPIRTRKLLLNKSEILKLQQAQQVKGHAIIALAIGLVGKHIKVEIAVARGRKKSDKRELIKKRDLDREASRNWN